MGVPYAEVIGDPVAHSKSPLIHKFWLEKLGITGDYRAQRVSPGEVARHVRMRCADPFWRGCSVTAPLKPEAAAAALDPTGVCARIGAANALFRSPLGCAVGANTDLIGLAAALGAADGLGKVCVVGAGGAARTALGYLRIGHTAEISLLVRDVARARPVHQAFGLRGEIHGLDASGDALAGAGCVINATPLGMAGKPPMPAAILDALERTADQALVFDMVYVPLETELLRRARALGRRTADGLVMLIGQAAPAFELFFGTPAPREHDAELRERLAA